MNTFKANKRLPPDIIIHSAETHMFHIGLSLFENESTKRTKLHNPVFITLVNTISLMRCIISLLLPQENEKPFIIIGNFSYFLGIRVHFNLAYGLYILLALTSQLLHYINYKNDIKPIYLKPFTMMSGLISPQNIGLTNRDKIYKLIKLSKLTFFVCRFNADITIAVLYIYFKRFALYYKLFDSGYHTIWYSSQYFYFVVVVISYLISIFGKSFAFT
jgi:hypothetical protein